MQFLGAVVRFIVAALVLMVVGWIVPQFEIGGFWSALLLALVIAAAGWVLEGIFGRKITPFGRGIVGFLTSAAVIWLAQFIVGGVEVSVIGAILAALVIGIIDLFIPVSTPFEAGSRNKDGDREKAR
ncbi:phage holin family protein [Xylanibacillus composti]|uniref:Membrane protein n=1 Tax=Xylanibacillus composti TaxID=1572762 RepID=A0A8J4H4T2_9BACL|nr:phage holin family protein [Xylanibacillus composti]MDT9724677.1 phage holin family protein [Xylanibacillus composti]GIQ70963.1 membrane protein [Xylanibacillus composti]